MKSVNKILVLLIALIPFVVSASDISTLPAKIETSEGIVFYNYGDKYWGYSMPEVDTIVLNPSSYFPEYYFEVDGNINVLLNDTKTIYNVKAYANSDKNSFVTIPFEIVVPANEEQSVTLKDLDVVGFNLDYKPNLNEYKVTVPDYVTEVYVSAIPQGNLTKIAGDGIIKVDKKTNEVNIEVYNETVGVSNYKITIVKKNIAITYIIFTSIFFIAIIGVMLFFFKKYQDKASSVNPSILKRKIKEVNVDEIISSVKEKNKDNMNDIAGENITPGVLTPRTMIPDENNK